MSPTLAALSSAQTGSPLGPAVPEPEPQPEQAAPTTPPAQAEPEAVPPQPAQTKPQETFRSLTDRPAAPQQGDTDAATEVLSTPTEAPPPDAYQSPSELVGSGTVAQPSTPAEWIERLRAEYADSMLPGMLLAFGVLVIMYLMMRRLIRRPRPAVAPAETRLQEIHDRAATNTAPIERTMAEAEQLARRLAATLDNKADRIDLLIQEADRKLEELNKAIAQVARHTPVSTQERPQRPIRSIDPALMDRARVEQDRAERRPDPERNDSPRPEPRLAQSAPDDGNPVHRRVWALADDGMPPIEIARSLNQPIGQVELILNLRKSG